jgi:hypothetical protein
MAGRGGLRPARKDSPNIGWRNTSLRDYADYMQTKAFEDGARNAHRNEPERTCRHQVRRNRAVALPPLAGGRPTECARHPGGRDFTGEQLPQATVCTACGRIYCEMAPEKAQACFLSILSVWVRGRSGAGVQDEFTTVSNPGGGLCGSQLDIDLDVQSRQPEIRRLISSVQSAR